MFFIETNSGLQLGLACPKEDEICIEDIAHGLARQSRFAGQFAFSSVAKHSVQVVKMVEADIESGALYVPKFEVFNALMYALLHDASEAYICDLPSPLKQLCPDYRLIESRVMRAVYKKFGVTTSGFEATIKEYDLAARVIERNEIKDKTDFRHSFADDETLFLDTYRDLIRVYK